VRLEEKDLVERLYQVVVHLNVCPWEEVKYLYSIALADYEDPVRAFVLPLGKREYLLWMEDFDFDEVEHHGMLAHEVVHLVNWVFGYIGVSWGDESEEPFCYLVDYWHRTILEALYDAGGDEPSGPDEEA
jgi:hypothetical protein